LDVLCVRIRIGSHVGIVKGVNTNELSFWKRDGRSVYTM
jgi:hypothetical protein